jgi:hypothetical protein
VIVVLGIAVGASLLGVGGRSAQASS